VMARGLVVELPPSRPRKPQPAPALLRNGVGTGIVMPRGYSSYTPPASPGSSRGSAPSPSRGGSCHVLRPPPPRWGRWPVGPEGVQTYAIALPLKGGARGGGSDLSSRRFAFPLLDPLPRRRTSGRPAALGVPRISFPGFIAPHPVAVRRPPSPGDAIDAARLALRLASLASALDDLPGQARRFARWRARRDKAVAQDKARDAAGAQDRRTRDRRRFRRIWPLRPGRPPGGRQKPVHEVHEVLRDLQWFAVKAMERIDTS
jgi:hypothetical protein